MAFFTFLIAPVAVHAQSGNVTLWNKLGSDTEIINSEIGPGGQKMAELSCQVHSRISARRW
jgi:hypothetical protein